MAIIQHNGVVIRDADQENPIDDTFIFADVKRNNALLSVTVANNLSVGGVAAAQCDEAAAKALIQVINEEAAAVFPGWPVVVSGL